MTIAISIDDGLLQKADDTARSLGLSRSGLFVLAMEEFLTRRKQEAMLARLNEV